MQDGELKGTIKALQFAPRVEAIEPVAYSLDDYRRILQQLRQMDEALTRPQAQRSPDHAAWILSGKLRDIIEPLQSFVWDMEERGRTRRLQIRAFRPKAARWVKDSWRGSKLDSAALFAQSDIRDYLNGLYQTADACFTREQLYQAQLQTELRWLQMAYRGHLDRTQGQGGLLIRSLLPGQGHAALAYLAENLRRVINDLGSVEAEGPVDDGILLQYQGPGLDRLAVCEQGIHLFIAKNNAQLPIAVMAIEGESTEGPIAVPDTIIRLYALPRPNADRRDDTLTDLRSGMPCGTDLGLEDLKLLVAAGLAEENTSFTEGTC